MILPIVIAIGTLLVAKEYEKRQESAREDSFKKRESDAVKAAREALESEYAARESKAKARRQKLKMERLEKENSMAKLISLKGGGA
jgi:hypothetical protein